MFNQFLPGAEAHRMFYQSPFLFVHLPIIELATVYLLWSFWRKLCIVCTQNTPGWLTGSFWRDKVTFHHMWKVTTPNELFSFRCYLYISNPSILTPLSNCGIEYSFKFKLNDENNHKIRAHWMHYIDAVFGGSLISKLFQWKAFHQQFLYYAQPK